MANQHMKKKINLISHQGNKIKTIMRYHSKPSRPARIKMTDHTKDLEQLGLPHINGMGTNDINTRGK